MISEQIPDGHRWLRICEARWDDPLDPSFAQVHGGRWNPPDTWPTLYLNEDVVTARLNLEAFIAGWPYRPEDLDDASGPQLATATLPRNQTVADVHTPQGVAAVGLPPTYPVAADGTTVPHDVCQRIGVEVKQAELRGVRCRSAQAPLGAGRELAWFPATTRSRAHLIGRLPFAEWFWG